MPDPSGTYVNLNPSRSTDPATGIALLIASPAS